MISNRLLIPLTFLSALMLDALPLPTWATWFCPEWVLLVLIYWNIELPETVGVITAFFIGLLVDLLNGTLLGEHALAFIIIAYIAIKLHQLLRVYPLVQQAFVVFFLALGYQTIIFGIQGFINQLPHTLLYWTSALTSAILCPWVFTMIHDFKRIEG